MAIKGEQRGFMRELTRQAVDIQELPSYALESPFLLMSRLLPVEVGQMRKGFTQRKQAIRMIARYLLRKGINLSEFSDKDLLSKIHYIEQQYRQSMNGDTWLRRQIEMTVITNVKERHFLIEIRRDVETLQIKEIWGK